MYYIYCTYVRMRRNCEVSLVDAFVLKLLYNTRLVYEKIIWIFFIKLINKINKLSVTYYNRNYMEF